MKKVLFTFLLISVVVTLSPNVTHAQETSGEENPLLTNEEVRTALIGLDAWITAEMESASDPGLSIGIVHDQDLLWAKGYGFADLDNRIPATPSTLYRLASITKLFTATAIMQLRDQGQLQLDDPVAKHLSWFEIMNPYPEGPSISIRQLLTHTSGLPREVPGTSQLELTFPARQELIQELPNTETVFPGAAEWKYSNLGFTLAGEVVSAISGKSWADYIDRYILQPLEMIRTTPLPTPDMPGLAVGYVRSSKDTLPSLEPAPFIYFGAAGPSANLTSNVEDLAKFVALQFRNHEVGGHVLTASTLGDMHRVHWLHPDWNSGWGLGFWVRRVGDQTRVGHGGRLRGYSTVLEMIPEDKLGIIVLMNINGGNPGSYLEKAFETVGPAIRRASVLLETILDDPEPQWQQFAGTYGEDAGIQLAILNGHLTIIPISDATPWQSQIVLTPVSELEFKAIASNPAYHPTTLHGEVFRFDLDSDGEVIGFGNDSFYWNRR